MLLTTPSTHDTRMKVIYSFRVFVIVDSSGNNPNAALDPGLMANFIFNLTWVTGLKDAAGM